MNDGVNPTTRRKTKLRTAQEIHDRLLEKKVSDVTGPIGLAMMWSIAWGVIFWLVHETVSTESFLGHILGGLVILPWVFIFIAFDSVRSDARRVFWKQIAKKYGWGFESIADTSAEKGSLFSVGYAGYAQNKINGTYKNHPFTIFEYKYSEGHGKDVSTFFFTVFECTFKGTFPHIYLNYKHDDYAVKQNSALSSLVEVSVPHTFQKEFRLYVPQKYEIEALEIFTSEIFVLLLDKGWNYDMEFVDGELLIYQNFKFDSFESLDTELTKIKEIIDILAPRLNRMKLTEIGDLSPLLTKS